MKLVRADRARSELQHAPRMPSHDSDCIWPYAVHCAQVRPILWCLWWPVSPRAGTATCHLLRVLRELSRWAGLQLGAGAESQVI